MKKESDPPPGADHGRKMHTAGLPSPRFLKENSKRRTKIRSRLTRVSKDFKDINVDPKALPIHFFVFVKAKLFSNYAWLRRTKCTKIFRILLLLYNLHIFASDQIKEESN